MYMYTMYIPYRSWLLMLTDNETDFWPLFMKNVRRNQQWPREKYSLLPQISS